MRNQTQIFRILDLPDDLLLIVLRKSIENSVSKPQCYESLMRMGGRFLRTVRSPYFFTAMPEDTSFMTRRNIKALAIENKRFVALQFAYASEYLEKVQHLLDGARGNDSNAANDPCLGCTEIVASMGAIGGGVTLLILGIDHAIHATIDNLSYYLPIEISSGATLLLSLTALLICRCKTISLNHRGEKHHMQPLTHKQINDRDAVIYLNLFPSYRDAAGDLRQRTHEYCRIAGELLSDYLGTRAEAGREAAQFISDFPGQNTMFNNPMSYFTQIIRDRHELSYIARNILQLGPATNDALAAEPTEETPLLPGHSMV